MTATVDDYLKELEPWVETWGVMTQAEREVTRRNATSADLQAFYDALVPRMEGIIDVLNRYPIDALPENARTLLNLTLSLAEIAPHVEFYKGSPGVPYAFEEERFISERAHWTRL